MKRMRMGFVGAVGLAQLLLFAAPAAAQEGWFTPRRECAAEDARGDLGISGLDCRGECTLTMNERGEENRWSFTVEPRITGVARGGPSDGILRVGDDLVAIDGILITTSAGGRRFANIEPGEDVRVRFRRDGRSAEAIVHAGAACPAPPPPPRPDAVAPLVGRLAPPPTEPDEPRRAIGIAVAPRVRVDRGLAVAGAAPLPPLEVAGVAGVFLNTLPRARLGIGFSCTECGTRTDEETGESIWFFSGPVEVTAVNKGGPAEEAGLQIGDLIMAMDGHGIDTDEGGRAFTRLKAGEPVRVTVVKRNGREVDVSLVPEEAIRPVVLGVAAPVAEVAPVTEPVVEVAPAAPPAPPARVADWFTEPDLRAPTGMPLRYSRTINGVEVEVRGDPVMVSEMPGARIVTITAEGLWIRIRIPPGGGDPPEV
jgi:hypothetical protein